MKAMLRVCNIEKEKLEARLRDAKRKSKLMRMSNNKAYFAKELERLESEINELNNFITREQDYINRSTKG